MNTFTIYETATGKVLQTTHTNVAGAELCADGQSFIEGAHTGYIGVEPVAEPIIMQLRVERNNLLKYTDWTQMPDAPLTDAKKAEWATYRQELRDLPSQYTTETNIDNVVYPTRPEA